MNFLNYFFKNRYQSRYFLIIGLILFKFFLNSCQQQNTQFVTAEKLFNEKKYRQAIPLYENALQTTQIKSIITQINKRLNYIYYTLGKKYFDEKQFTKAIEYLTSLENLSYKTNEKNIQEMIIQSRLELSKQVYIQKKYHETIQQIDLLKKKYTVPDMYYQSTNDLIINSLYAIAINHYDKQEYYLAINYFNQLKMEYPHSDLTKKSIPYLEESYFKDGELQFSKKAYQNALSSYKEVINKKLFPNNKYFNEANRKIQIINKILNENPQYKQIKKIDTQQILEDKGNSYKKPYNNKDLQTLIKVLQMEMKKNPEELKLNIFKIYKNKYIDLTALNYSHYKPVSPKKIQKKEINNLLNNFFSKNKTKPNIIYKYILYTKTYPQLNILITQEDFLKIDFRKSFQFNIQGNITDLKLIQNDISITISTSNIKFTHIN